MIFLNIRKNGRLFGNGNCVPDMNEKVTDSSTLFNVASAIAIAIS